MIGGEEKYRLCMSETDRRTYVSEQVCMCVSASFVCVYLQKWSFVHVCLCGCAKVGVWVCVPHFPYVVGTEIYSRYHRGDTRKQVNMMRRLVKLRSD